MGRKQTQWISVDINDSRIVQHRYHSFVAEQGVFQKCL
ncbi:hypothetical protein GXM_03252 [Nostoc sphaeroides CCNUC1]|uniref:Uncharacterized protein n=1 Tax=Nostoc sphaeroides CCNUC1 TaxID=2653204 RepID=A0A5P8VZA9_9NOSO|nr:hypothetical protein GXM_03252 [Nostoc sphaeroides CCNUC1]